MPREGSDIMMDRRWLPLNALRAFEAVGRHLSFTAAANELLVSQSAVSRHVISLESLLGIQLFERKPQHLALTDAGRLLLPVVSKSFDRLQGALEEVIQEGGSLQRTLRIVLPPTFAHQLAVPILRDFRKDYPDIGLDIESVPGGPTDREADLAVIYAEPTVSDSVRDLLWMVRVTPVCHPDVAERWKGKSLAEFVAGNDLLHVRLDGQPRHYLWEMFVRQADCPGVRADRGLVFDTAQLAVQYALSGDGIALVDTNLFSDMLASGRLVQPFPIFLDDGYGYYLAIHPDDLGDTTLSLFRSWLIRRFAGASWTTQSRETALYKIHSMGETSHGVPSQ
jgi:DNA-binding transcriptional LysR family regulator